MRESVRVCNFDGQRMIEAGGGLYCLRIKLIDGRIQRRNCFFGRFSIFGYSYWKFSLLCSMKCGISFIVTYKEE